MQCICIVCVCSYVCVSMTARLHVSPTCLLYPAALCLFLALAQCKGARSCVCVCVCLCVCVCVCVCVRVCVLVGVGAWLHLPPAFLSINLTFTPYPGEAKWGWPAINVTISHLWCALLEGHPQYFFTGSYHMEIPFCNGYKKIHKIVISLSATLNLDVNWTEYILNSVVELKGQFTQK